MIARGTLRTTLSLALLGVAVGGCGLVLGIEDLSGENLGKGGGGASSSSTTTSNPGGGGMTTTTGSGGATTSSTSGTAGGGGTGGGLIGCGASCKPGDPVWVEPFGSDGADRGTGIAVSPAGDVFVTGHIGVPSDFGGGPLTGGIFAMKLDHDGKHVWSVSFPNCSQPKIGVGSDGNPVVAGIHAGTVTFGNKTYTGNGGFVVKLADGAPVWSRELPSTSGLVAMGGIEVASNGDVAIAGGFTGSVDLGAGNVTAMGEDLFVMELTASTGANILAKNLGSGAGKFNEATGVTFTGSSGQIAVTGKMNGTIDFGLGNVTASGGFFVWTLTAGGTTTHAKGFASAATVGIKTDGGGGVVVTGTIGSSASNLGGGAIPANSGFVAKYDFSLNHVFSKELAGVTPSGAAVDGLGNAIVTGSFSQTINVGSGDIMSHGSTDIFVGIFGAVDGKPVWARAFGGVESDEGVAVAKDGSTAVLVTGQVGPSADFDFGLLPPNSGADLFVARLMH
jgi:hypothetical protein